MTKLHGVEEMHLVDQQSNDSSCRMNVIWHQKVAAELMGCDELWNPNCKMITQKVFELPE